jgi:hypothetical protein
MANEPNPLRAMETELDALRADREILNKKISVMEEAIQLVRTVYSDAAEGSPAAIGAIDSLGFTDAVRQAMSAGMRMTPIEVRDELANNGFDLARYSNPLATIHTILKRLLEAGQLEELEAADGKSYRLLGHVEQKIRERSESRSTPPMPPTRVTKGLPDIANAGQLPFVRGPERPIGRQGNVLPPLVKGPRVK